MKEVSCRAFACFDPALREGRVTEEQLLSGVSYSLEHLRNRHERIEWSVFCRIARNAGQHLSPAEVEALGARFVSSPAFRAVVVVARLLFRSPWSGKWTKTLARDAQRMLTCVVHDIVVHDAEHFCLELTMMDDFEECPELFLLVKGATASLARQLASNEAKVEAHLSQRRASYHFYLPSRKNLRDRLVRLTSPRRVLAVVDELQEAHDDLLLRYAELETAREQLDVQAHKLRACHAISQLIQEPTDLEDTLEAIVRALKDELALDGARVLLDCTLEDTAITEEVVAGSPSGACLERDILSRGQKVGRLSIWPAVDSSAERIESILDFALPSVAMAVGNALTYDSVVRYRDALERRVHERTRELSETRDELARSVEELEQAEALRDRIFANINHEIRTPLAIVRLACEEARMAATTNSDRVVEELATIDRSVAKLLRLVDGLLLLAARDEGMFRLQPERLDLVQLLREEVATWEPIARKHALSLDMEAPAHMFATVDGVEMARVIGNLLSNAIKFTPDGGTIQILLAANEDCVTISVTDSGVGMSPEFALRAFERFEQGPKPVRTASQGSGIGLSIVREIVLAHGGVVSAQPAKAKGTCLRIELPLTQDTTDLAKPAAPLAQARVPTSDILAAELSPSSELDSDRHGVPANYSHSILLVEDDAELRAAMARCLRRSYRVLLAKDGREALELAQVHRPDLLVTDIEMPGMDGLQLTRRFTELSENRLAPTLLVTARATHKFRMMGFRAGALDYITKPFHQDELLARVRAQLAIRDLALKLHEAEQLASVGFLGSGLAHELRNPLNVLVNALAPLRRALPDDALEKGSMADRLFRAMQTSTERMLNICNSILEMENSRALRTEPVPVGELIEAAIHAVPGIAEADLRVRCPEPFTITCSRFLILQVLANLLENALRAAGPQATIEIRAYIEGEDSVIRVIDSGPGIAAEHREQVFAPFFTTAQPGKGTGLGLAISRKAALRHGGNLRVVASDHGCVMELRLPVRDLKTGDFPSSLHS